MIIRDCANWETLRLYDMTIQCEASYEEERQTTIPRGSRLQVKFLFPKCQPANEKHWLKI